MGKHDWFIGILGQLEIYAELNGLALARKAIFTAIEETISEQDRRLKAVKVVHLKDYKPGQIPQDVSDLVGEYAEEIADLLGRVF